MQQKSVGGYHLHPHQERGGNGPPAGRGSRSRADGPSALIRYIFTREIFDKKSDADKARFDILDENNEFIYAHSYQFDKFESEAAVEFNISDIDSGRIAEQGLGLAIYYAKIELIEDIHFFS
ncbi:hypothetical protein [Deinococcus marmoris]|uniref:hypothetical protein n=1 Tax=Deinococcus marmoris TaxID=249408 RepID=UPI0015887AB2|nr:hypothetical protein [Deinococcus marmoris]